MKNKAFTHSLALLSLAALLLLLIFLPACQKGTAQSAKYKFYEKVIDTSKPPAWGDERDIYVFCDAEVWKLLQSTLVNSLERETFIVVNEKYFHLIKSDIKDLDELMKYKNLLFIGDLQSKGAVSEHLRNTMDERMIERVKNSGGEMFIARNRWVNDQLVVYMVGSDLQNMLKLNIMQANRLYNVFLNRLGERLAYQAYLTKLIPENFFSVFPFTLKIPENYRIFSDDKKNHFLSFLYRIRSESKDFPDKYISVYYQKMEADSVKLSWLMEKRKQLAFKYYDGDEFDPKMVLSQRMTFGNYEAWSIIGPWVNKKYDVGGGFQSFAFYVPAQKMAYIIDNSVYFPEGDKLPVLLELQKISATFRAKQ